MQSQEINSFKTTQKSLYWTAQNFSLVIKHVDILWKKDTDTADSKMLKTKNGRPMLSSKCAVCRSKKSKFIKEQEGKGLLSSLGLKTPLCKVPLLGRILF